MKKYLLALMFLFVATPALANTSGYAWSESVGWFDFGNAVVSDTAVTGHAYNDNTGWLVLSNITNTNGTLDGYAWSESVGWFDFSDVTISGGNFNGYAYNDNTGFLSFEDTTTVSTTWAPPAGTPEPESRSSSGSSVASRIRNLTAQGNLSEAERLRQQYPNATGVTPNTNPTIPSPQTPTQARNLKLGDSGNDIKSLQIILNLLNYKISDQGPGSKGNETTLFGPLTQQALIKFQIDNNIEPAVGYFGPITRDALVIKFISLLLTS